MLSFSYSKLSDYAMCPFYFKSRHIDRLPVSTNDELSIGRIIHEILCDYAKECYRQGKTHLYDVPGAVDSIVDAVMRKYAISSDLEDEIRDCVNDYVCANEIELDGLAGVEEEIAVDKDMNVVPWDSPQAWFRVKLDLLYMREDQAEIRDYKTGYSMKPDKFQLQIYAWMIYRVYPQINFMQVQFDFTRFSYKTTTPIGKEALPSIQRKIKNRIRQITEDKEFLPQINANCNRCPFTGVCPAMKNVAVADMTRLPQNKAEAEVLLTKVVASNVYAKALEDLLKQYVDENGVVVANDIKAGFKAITSTKWNMLALKLWLEGAGHDLLDYVNVDNQKIKKVKGIPDELKNQEISTRFSIERKKSLDKEGGK